MNWTMPGSGELAALAAAGLWACSSLFYSRVRLTAWQINFGKNVLASGILLLHLGLQALVLRTSLLSVDQRAVVWLVLSSLTGIVIGDTLYFRSLQILGPRRALIVSTTSPLFAASAGWLLLSEPLSVMALSGLIVTLTGVFLVVTDRPVSGETAGHFPASVLRGVLAGLGGALCNASGAMFSHLATHTSVSSGSELTTAVTCSPLEATFIRVGFAAVLAAVVLTATGRLKATARPAFDPAILRTYLPAVICGPWLGIWMSQIAYRDSLLAVANTLTCTSPIFVLPLVRLAFGTPISLRALAGAVISVGGIYLTVAGK
ncbi:MAG: DMT family transporter [Planctomyces sp.]